MADPVVQHAEEWLRSRRSTLFGQAFDVSKDTEQAAQWFITQVDEFLTYVAEQEAKPVECPGCTGDPAEHPTPFTERHPGLPRHQVDVVA